MRKVLLSVIVLAGLVIAGPTMATNYYIDAQNGNDADTGSELTPWQSLSKINAIAGGDTIYLKGDFPNQGGALTLTAAISGMAGSPTIITAWPGEATSIQLTTGLGSPTPVFNVQSSYLTISGLDFNNGGTISANTYGVQLDTNIQNVTIENNLFRDTTIGVYATASLTMDKITLHGNTVKNTSYGFAIGSGNDLVITSNTIYATTIIGVWTGAQNSILVANNVFHGNYYSFRDQASGTVWFVHNTLYNNTYGNIFSSTAAVTNKNNIYQANNYGIVNQSVTSFASDYNLFNNNYNIGNDGSTNYANLTDWQALNFDEHSLEGDPMFLNVNVGSEDFNIAGGSAAIDAGLLLSGFTTEDMSGAPRPQGSTYDIGAYEYATVPTLTATTLKPKKIKFNWDDTCTSCTYTLKRSTKEDFSKNVKTYPNITSSKKTIKNMKPAKKYYWKIQSDNGVGTSDLSDSLLAPTIPKIISTVGKDAIESTTATVSWKKMKRIRNYEVKLLDGKGSAITTDKIRISNDYLSKNKYKYVSYTFNALEPGKKYRIKVRAKRKMGGSNYVSKWSNIKKFTTY